MSWRIIILEIMVGIFFQACGASVGTWNELPVKIVDNGRPELKAAVDFYNEYFATPVYELVTDGGVEVQNVDSLPLELDGNTTTNWNADGVITSGVIYIRSTLGEYRYRMVVLHEMGHLLGYHAHDKIGIMRKITYGSVPNVFDVDISFLSFLNMYYNLTPGGDINAKTTN